MNIKEKVESIQDFITSKIGYETDITTGVKALAESGGGDTPVRSKFASFDNILTFAHRGITTQKTYENTMTAFKECAKNGYGGIEIDVRFTSDNIPVLLHYESFTSFETDTTITVKNVTFEELQRHTIKNTTGEKVPSFEEVLAFCKDNNINVMLEIKESYLNAKVGAQLSELLTIIHDYEMEEHVIITSFEYNWLTLVKNNAPSLMLGYVYQDSYTTTVLNNLLGLKTETNKVMLHLVWNNITEAITTELLENGIELGAWTSTPISNILRFINWGVKYFALECKCAEFIYATKVIVSTSDMKQGRIEIGRAYCRNDTIQNRVSWFLDTFKNYGGKCRCYVGGYCLHNGGKATEVTFRYNSQYVKTFYNNAQWSNINENNAVDSGWLSFSKDYTYNLDFPASETFFFGQVHTTDNANITPSNFSEAYISYMPFAEDTDYAKYLAKVLPLVEE